MTKEVHNVYGIGSTDIQDGLSSSSSRASQVGDVNTEDIREKAPGDQQEERGFGGFLAGKHAGPSTTCGLCLFYIWLEL